jgi:low affinity Fe/Cu permease
MAFFAGVIAGVAAVGLILIVLTPSRRLREEARIDREIETRLLLGVDPEPHDAVDLDHAPAELSAKELQELRRIGTERATKRGPRRN